MSLVLANTYRKALLQCLTKATADQVDGALVGCKVMLFTDGPDPLTADMLYADFTEAAFTGYARSSTLTYGTPSYSEAGIPELTAAAVSFTMTDTAATQTIKGFCLVTGTGGSTIVHAAQYFAEDVNLSIAGQGLDVTVVASLDSNSYGNALVLA